MATNGMDNMEDLAKMAYYEASLAAVVIPNAWSMVAIIYGAQSNPGELWDAGDDWYEVKQRLVTADKAVREELRSLSNEDWEGEDRKAFESKLNAYQNQIRVSYTFALTIHLILKIVALLIAAFIAAMWAFATIIAAYAAVIVALMVFSFLPPVATALANVRAQATVIAGQLYMVLKRMNSALEHVFTGCAATIGALMVGDVLGQMVTGNTDAYGDFIEATVNSADDVIKGRLALLEQQTTANFMGGKNILGGLSGKTVVGVQLPRHLPKAVRPFVGPVAGAKGWADVGFDINPGGDPKNDWRDRAGGSPSLTRPFTKGTEYGDSYVDKTNPLANMDE